VPDDRHLRRVDRRGSGRVVLDPLGQRLQVGRAVRRGDVQVVGGAERLVNDRAAGMVGRCDDEAVMPPYPCENTTRGKRRPAIGGVAS